MYLLIIDTRQAARRDSKELSLESRKEKHRNESRMFEHSLAWRLVLYSLAIT